jgi:hypothetical protein
MAYFPFASVVTPWEVDFTSTLAIMPVPSFVEVTVPVTLFCVCEKSAKHISMLHKTSNDLFMMIEFI